MSDFSYYPLQKAIFETLNADSLLDVLVTGIFDRVPQGQAYPYVTIGESSGSDWSTKTSAGIEYSVTINAWSREGGRKEIAQIFENIYRILHDNEITMPSHKMVLIRFISSTITVETDGITYHGIMRFKVLLESQ